MLALEKLPDLAERMHVLIGIITVPAPEAQAVADLMVAGGIRAIWNFAPIRLRVPAACDRPQRGPLLLAGGAVPKAFHHAANPAGDNRNRGRHRPRPVRIDNRNQP